MTIDVNFFENLSDDLKRTVSDASKAIMDVYERNTFECTTENALRRDTLDIFGCAKSVYGFCDSVHISNK
mgnify:CR=1 FL=1